MSYAWLWIVALVSFIGFVGRATVADLFSEEVRTRLARFPLAIIRRASRRVPSTLQSDLRCEWNAELEHVLNGSEGLPLTRLVRGIRFAAGLLVAAPAIAHGLAGYPGVAEGAPIPVTLGDVWVAIDRAHLPLRRSAACGTAYLAHPDGQQIRLPNKTFFDHGVASDELLTVLASWGVWPVASGEYPLPLGWVGQYEGSWADHGWGERVPAELRMMRETATQWRLYDLPGSARSTRRRARRARRSHGRS